MYIIGRKGSQSQTKRSKQSTQTSTPGVQPAGRRSRGETGEAASLREEGNEEGIDLERGAERNGGEWRLKGEWEKTDG